MLKRFIDWITDIIYVPKCVFCKNVLEPGASLLVCGDCLTSLLFIKPPLCVKCGIVLSTEFGPDICGRCAASRLSFKRNYVPFVYSGAVRSSILRFKRSGIRSHAHTYARLIEDRMIAQKAPRTDLVTFVPLSAKRLAGRGFNQSELIANELARILGIPCVPSLAKMGETPLQSSLSPARRKTIVRGVYETLPDAELRGKTILLLDDILTTGSTISECARQLKRAGAREVYAASLAITAPKTTRLN